MVSVSCFHLSAVVMVALESGYSALSGSAVVEPHAPLSTDQDSSVPVCWVPSQNLTVTFAFTVPVVAL